MRGGGVGEVGGDGEDGEAGEAGEDGEDGGDGVAIGTSVVGAGFTINIWLSP
ncbi:MAG: hypothetical protein RIB93_07370 [Coleofasciculus sp. D1-CHI-01]|uniref:hypothetical protein n=1 Tax=Coleofasciculus sp. D1-CHI-01 TaxID=3068482 RepID=UPI0032F4E536